MLVSTMFVFTSNSTFAKPTVITNDLGIKSIPQELKDLGFTFSKSYDGSWAIGIPSDVVSNYVSKVGSNIGVFKKFTYERKGDDVEFSFENTVGENGVININLDTYEFNYKNYENGNLQAQEKGSYTRLHAIATRLQNTRKYENKTDYIIAEFDSENKVIKIKENTNSLFPSKKKIKLEVPNGIKINVIGGNKLILEDTTGCSLSSGGLFSSGIERQIVLLDLEDHLKKGVIGQNKSAHTGYAAYDNNGTGMLSTSLSGNLQQVLDHFLAEHYKCQLRKNDTEVTSNGYRLYSSTTGKSKLLFNDDPGKHVVLANGWRTYGVVTQNNENEYIITERKDKFLVHVNHKDRTYSAKRVDQ